MSDRRTSRREARRQEIIDAAMRIVVEQGIDSLTMPGLASELDAAVGALYRYFPGKDALILALELDAVGAFLGEFQARARRVAEALADVDAPAGVRAIAGFLATTQGYHDHALEQPARHQLIDAVLSTPARLLTDDQAREVDDTIQPIFELLGGFLSSAADAGVLRPGDVARRTMLLWASVHGLDHFRKRDRIMPDALRVDALFPRMLRTLLCGWGATGDAIDAAEGLVDALDQ